MFLKIRYDGNIDRVKAKFYLNSCARSSQWGISIIHPRCIKVGLQWCTIFIADFGLYASYRLLQKPRHDYGRAKPPSWSRRAMLVPPTKKNKLIINFTVWLIFYEFDSIWKRMHLTLLPSPLRWVNIRVDCALKPLYGSWSKRRKILNSNLLNSTLKKDWSCVAFCFCVKDG